MWFEFRRDNINLWIAIILISGLIGITYSQLVYSQVTNDKGSIWLGAINGIIIGACSAGFELFFVSSAFSPMRKLAFIPALLVRVAVHLTMIFLSLLFSQIVYDQIYGTGILMFDPEIGGATTDLAFAFLVMSVVIFYMQMRLFIGSRTLKNLVLGKYSRPQKEERIFMFLDIAGSTDAAQKIGDVEFHRYLNQLFILFDGPITRSGGEVHSYVGDAIIAIWPLSVSPIENSRVIGAMSQIDQLCQLHSKKIHESFGVEPDIRIAIHGGPVVAGETGDSKRQITYLGDTVNITARIEAKAKELGERFLVSDAILERITLPNGVETRSLGSHFLKGVGEKMALSAIRLECDPNTKSIDGKASMDVAIK